jgi:tight adherence protein B
MKNGSLIEEHRMEIFIAVTSAVLIFCIAYLIFNWIFRNRIRVRGRIDDLVTIDKKERKPLAEKKKEEKKDKGLGFGKKISSDLESAGILLRPHEYLLVWAGTTIIPSLLFLLLGGNPLSVIVLLFIGFIIPPLIVARSKRLRKSKFEKQLGESIMLISNNLRAGFTFQQAMESISKEMAEPIAGEFGRTLWEIKLGASTEDAMERMVIRTDSYDLGLLVSAVLIQRKTGGNLADVLDNISNTIKERLRIRGEIKALTASGRISGIIIGMLPVFLTAVLMVVNPSYILDFFLTPVGLMMVVVAVIMELLGFLIIKKIIDIKL